MSAFYILCVRLLLCMFAWNLMPFFLVSHGFVVDIAASFGVCLIQFPIRNAPRMRCTFEAWNYGHTHHTEKEKEMAIAIH